MRCWFAALTMGAALAMVAVPAEGIDITVCVDLPNRTASATWGFCAYPGGGCRQCIRIEFSEEEQGSCLNEEGIGSTCTPGVEMAGAELVAPLTWPASPSLAEFSGRTLVDTGDAQILVAGSCDQPDLFETLDPRRHLGLARGSRSVGEDPPVAAPAP